MRSLGFRMTCIVLIRSFSVTSRALDSEEGHFIDNSYVNDFFHLMFVPPSNLSFASDIAHANHLTRTFILAKAVGKSRPGEVTPVLFLSADRLRDYPEPQRTADGYMDKLVRDRQRSGYSLIEGAGRRALPGFLREDFEKGRLHEVVLVATREGFALVIIVIAGSQSEVNSIVETTKLSFAD